MFTIRQRDGSEVVVHFTMAGGSLTFLPVCFLECCLKNQISDDTISPAEYFGNVVLSRGRRAAIQTLNLPLAARVAGAELFTSLPIWEALDMEPVTLLPEDLLQWAISLRSPANLLVAEKYARIFPWYAEQLGFARLFLRDQESELSQQQDMSFHDRQTLKAFTTNTVGFDCRHYQNIDTECHATEEWQRPFEHSFFDPEGVLLYD
jgi:hypothetical protein